MRFAVAAKAGLTHFEWEVDSMNLYRAVEDKIQEAIAAGEFDNLPGAGKPINLSGYENTPEGLRMGYSLLKSNGFVPPEVELLREISALRDAMKENPNNPAIRERLCAAEVTFDVRIKRIRRMR